LREVVCNTSPIQYLHQVGLLHVLPALAGRVIVPSAVAMELAVGRAAGIDVPDISLLQWIEIRRPASAPASRLITDLGLGETEVLMLAIESTDPLVVLDDGVARKVASSLKLPLTGTVGLLIDAKRAGLVPAIAPVLDQLDNLRFRLAAATRLAALRSAGEVP